MGYESTEWCSKSRLNLGVGPIVAILGVGPIVAILGVGPSVAIIVILATMGGGGRWLGVFCFTWLLLGPSGLLFIHVLDD